MIAIILCVILDNEAILINWITLAINIKKISDNNVFYKYID